jgi:hypothetical protein
MQTDRQTDRQVDRQMDILREKVVTLNKSLQVEASSRTTSCIVFLCFKIIGATDEVNGFVGCG